MINIVTMINPLLQEWETPFGSPPFDKINLSHFKPAIREAIRIASGEIKAITDNTEPPDFNNTIAALKNPVRLLGKSPLFCSILIVLKPPKNFRQLPRKFHPFLHASQMILP